MDTQNTKAKITHVQWWVWFLMGIAISWIIGVFFKASTGFIPSGIAVFGLGALTWGLISGIVTFIRKKRGKTQRRYLSLKKGLALALSVPFLLGMLLAVLQTHTVADNSAVEQNNEQLTAQSAIATPDLVLTIVNQKRGENNTEPLIFSNELNISAQFKAEDMANREYFNHTDPSTGKKNGIDKAFELTGMFCSYISENIYSGDGPYTTAEASVNAWMNSEPHKLALLDKKYSYTGIGIAQAKDGTVYQVEHFCLKN